MCRLYYRFVTGLLQYITMLCHFTIPTVGILNELYISLIHYILIVSSFRTIQTYYICNVLLIYFIIPSLYDELKHCNHNPENCLLRIQEHRKIKACRGGA